MKQWWEIETDVATSQPWNCAESSCQPLCSEINVASVTFYVWGTLAKTAWRNLAAPKTSILMQRQVGEQHFGGNQKSIWHAWPPAVRSYWYSASQSLPFVASSTSVLTLRLFSCRRNITGLSSESTSLFFLPPSLFFFSFLTALLWGMTHFWGALDPRAW